MSSRPPDFNEQVIAEFRANGGRVGGRFADMTLLLLHHAGARSGTPRVNPLAYMRDGDRYVIFASKAGAPTNPDWYHNLRAHPDVTIEVGDRSLEVRASDVTGAERDRLYAAAASAMPQFAGYQAQTERVIPVVVLTAR